MPDSKIRNSAVNGNYIDGDVKAAISPDVM